MISADLEVEIMSDDIVRVEVRDYHMIVKQGFV